MKRTLALTLALVFPAFIAPAHAVDSTLETTEVPLFQSGETVDLDDLKWKYRPVIVFADSADDPRFIEQMALLERDADALRERDILVFTDTTPDPKGTLRTKMRPRGFMMVLVGKDGGVKLRKPFPWDVRELSRVVDKMPMRQQEIRDRRTTE
jgi:hypothetical protein